jgi:exonuclease SbcD
LNKNGGIMKILHLADLHIGKIVFEQSMLEDQKYMLNQMIKKIKEENIELVLISGDVYDRSVPPADAVNVLDNFLKILIKDLKLKVCMIAGNHDSKERLNFGSKIFSDDGLYICANYTGNIDKVELEDEYGKINIYMLPYLKPIDVKGYFEDEEITSYHNAVKNVIQKEDINENERNIILSHQFVTAGNEEPEKSDSETLFLGGTENVDVSCYDKFDYVALGHIHGPQKIGRDTARYAGTMLKYSFSEVNQKKSLTILDFKEKDNLEIKQILLKPVRDMRVIKGPIEELVKEENYSKTNREDYIRAIITNEEPVYDAIGQIKKVYPNTLRLDIENSKTTENLDVSMSDLDNIKKKDEVELFNEFYKFQHNKDLDEKQLEIIKDVVKNVKKEEN